MSLRTKIVSGEIVAKGNRNYEKYIIKFFGNGWGSVFLLKNVKKDFWNYKKDSVYLPIRYTLTKNIYGTLSLSCKQEVYL